MNNTSVEKILMNIEDASKYLQMCRSKLSTMAHEGKVPAAKPGKRWVFIKEDLDEWLRSQYKYKSSINESSERDKPCQFTNVKAPRIGGLNSPMQKENAYSSALGLSKRS
jgi:excisionase family DNA binding protein